MSDGTAPGIVVGTAGHVDHGKTSLVRALTGVETDRWREEKERGLTIDLGFARLDLGDDLEVGLVDVPGHEDFLKNMLAGATGIDAVLLVVAADEGPMPQTLEHFEIARLLDIRRGVVALTKRDKVEDEWLELAREATRELLEGAGRGDWPIVPLSSTTGEGVDDLRAALARTLRDVDATAGDDIFRLPVDRAFSIHGTGTVVTGTVWSGRVRVGDAVRIHPGDRNARVRGLEVHGSRRDEVGSGRRCAAALVGVGAGEVGRGSTLVLQEGWRPAGRLGVRLTTLARPGRVTEHGQRLRVFLGTHEVMARVHTADRAPILPGDTARAVLDLETPMLARVGDLGIVRFYSPVTTIGGLEVAELDPPADWPGRWDRWSAVLDGAPEDALAAAVDLCDGAGLSREEAPVRTGLTPAEVAAAEDRLEAVSIGDRWFSVGARDAALDAARATVAGLQESKRRSVGVSREAVRSGLARGRDVSLAEDAIRELVARGELVERGALLARAGHEPDLTQAEREALDRLATAIVSGGLQPPRVPDLAADLRLDRAVLDDLLRLLQEDGVTRAVTPEIHVGAEVLDGFVGRVREILAGGRPAGPQVFKETFDLSRKYLIPLLEYLDRNRVTRRTGEGRVLAGD